MPLAKRSCRQGPWYPLHAALMPLVVHPFIPCTSQRAPHAVHSIPERTSGYLVGGALGHQSVQGPWRLRRHAPRQGKCRQQGGLDLDGLSFQVSGVECSSN